MVNVKLIISYDGTDYHGFQKQDGVLTIEGILEEAICKILKREKVEISCAGRTDKGVHAEGQVINFISDIEKMKETNWIKALNSILPENIRVTDCEYVNDDFNARFSARCREYWYFINNKTFPSALETRYSLSINYPLDVDKINGYCKYLVGEYDFTSFCSVMDQSQTKIRTIYDLKAEKNENFVIIKIKGSAFLHNMVRIIVGTILDLYRKDKPYEYIYEILMSKDRQKAGQTVPPNGLIFKKVYYDDSFLN